MTGSDIGMVLLTAGFLLFSYMIGGPGGLCLSLVLLGLIILVP